MPADRRPGARRRARGRARSHQPRAARRRGRHARAGRGAARAADARPARRPRRWRCSTTRFHEGVVGIVAVAPEGPAAPADLRLRASAPTGCSRARAARSPASTCATRSTWSAKRHPGVLQQASAATRWPPAARIAREDFDDLRRRASQQVAARMARRRDAVARAGAPTARWRSNASTPRPSRALDAQVWGQALRGAAVLRRGRGGVAAPGRREAPEAARAPRRRSCATRSGSATASRCPSACGWPTG